MAAALVAALAVVVVTAVALAAVAVAAAAVVVVTAVALAAVAVAAAAVVVVVVVVVVTAVVAAATKHLSTRLALRQPKMKGPLWPFFHFIVTPTFKMACQTGAQASGRSIFLRQAPAYP